MRPCSSDAVLIIASTASGLVSVYQMKGISRYLTFCMYSLYPGSSLRRTSSSFRILYTRTRGRMANTGSAQYEPRAIGVASNMMLVPRYIGWRTRA